MNKTPISSKITVLRAGKTLAHKPKCPSYLDPLAAKEWKRVVPLLQEINTFSHLDMTAIAAHCQAFSFWIRASELLMEDVLILPTGHLNPLHRIVKSSADTLLKTCVQLGMSPESRSAKKGRGKYKDE
jgi:P27 family predicted phage terminase small subunit